MYMALFLFSFGFVYYDWTSIFNIQQDQFSEYAVFGFLNNKPKSIMLQFRSGPHLHSENKETWCSTLKINTAPESCMSLQGHSLKINFCGLDTEVNETWIYLP